MNKPFSQACENNKPHILSILTTTLNNSTNLLEIGSGTGQHAVHFAANMPWLQWQTSDVTDNHNGINQWLNDFPASNLLAPITLDLNHSWPIKKIDAIYTANTLHIVSWPLVQAFFQGVAKHLAKEGKLCIYGPFNYQGKFTSDSNANFNEWLKERDEDSGIRDIEAITELAIKSGLKLENDHEMPANNRLLIFKKLS